MQCATPRPLGSRLRPLMTKRPRRWRCPGGLSALLGGRNRRNLHFFVGHRPSTDFELHRHPDPTGHRRPASHGWDEPERANPLQSRAIQVPVTRTAEDVRAESTPLSIHIHHKLPLPLPSCHEGCERVPRRSGTRLHRVNCRRVGKSSIGDQADALAKGRLIPKAAAAFQPCQVRALALTLAGSKAVDLVEKALLGQNVALLLCGQPVLAGSGIHFQRRKAFARVGVFRFAMQFSQADALIGHGAALVHHGLCRRTCSGEVNDDGQSACVDVAVVHCHSIDGQRPTRVPFCVKTRTSRDAHYPLAVTPHGAAPS